MGSTHSLDAKTIHSALKQSILINFGDSGWGAVGFSLTGQHYHSPLSFFSNSFLVKYFSPMTNVAIIRVARDRHSIAWGGITLLKEIGTSKIIPHVVHVSGTSILSISPHPYSILAGTIKHAQLAAIAHNRQLVARLRARSKLPGVKKKSSSLS